MLYASIIIQYQKLGPSDTCPGARIHTTPPPDTADVTMERGGRTRAGGQYRYPYRRIMAKVFGPVSPSWDSPVRFWNSVTHAAVWSS
jgi:hypothetical protein